MIHFFTHFSPNDTFLKPQRVDIWQFPLHTPLPIPFIYLNEDEKVRAQRFHFAKHQRRFSTARAMMRLILGRYLKQDPHTLKFNYNPHGKPEITSNLNLQFNLSHSKEVAMLAVGSCYALGIDVEYFSARPYQGIGEHIFSESENDLLKITAPALLPLTFFNIWAQKEALIKACGLGLSYPTKTFDLLNLPPADTQLIDPHSQQKWRILSFMPATTCCAALCMHSEISEVRFLSISDIKSLL